MKGQGGRRIEGGLYENILSEPRFEPTAVSACPWCLVHLAGDSLIFWARSVALYLAVDVLE